MKAALFWTFLLIFVATAAITLLGLTGQMPIKSEYLTPLFTGLILETIAAVILLFKSVQFFGDDQRLPEKTTALCGYWWELNHHAAPGALSFVEIRPSAGPGPLEMMGTAFAEDGKKIQTWRSVATALDTETMELYYFWRGDDLVKAQTDLLGIGNVEFTPVAGNDKCLQGDGWYTIGDSGQDAKRLIEMIRVKDEDAKVMRADDQAAKRALAASVYKAWQAAPADSSHASLH